MCLLRWVCGDAVKDTHRHQKSPLNTKTSEWERSKEREKEIVGCFCGTDQRGVSWVSLWHLRLTVVLPLITAISFLTLCLSSLTLILPLSVTLFLYSPSFYSISHLNYSIIVHNNNFVLGKCRAQSFLSACEIRKLHLRFITSKVARTPLSLSFPSLPFCGSLWKNQNTNQTNFQSLR